MLPGFVGQVSIRGSLKVERKVARSVGDIEELIRVKQC